MRKGVDTLGGASARPPSKKDVVAVVRISDHSALPSSARSEASIFFKFNAVRSERDVVAVARFSNFKSP